MLFTLLRNYRQELVPFFYFCLFIRKLGVKGYGSLSFIKLLSLFLIVVGLTQEGAISRYFILTENVH